MLKKLINNYAFEKTKHLELSDTFLEHSQIFSDSFQILKALGQAISFSILKSKKVLKLPKNTIQIMINVDLH